MKFKNGFALVIPHIESDGGWARTMITTNDPIDHRRVKRGIRTWVKQNLGRRIGPVELRLLYKKVSRHTQPMLYIPQRFQVKDDEFAPANG